MSVREDAVFALPFELKITKVVEGASGKVVVRNPFLQDPKLQFDPEPANNTASLVLNAEDSGTGDSGSTTGDGGTSSTGTTGTTGTTGSAGDSGATTGDGSTGSAGSSSSGSTGGDSGGGLAATGSAALMTGAAAVVALVAGGVLYTVSRRRAAA